MSDVDDWYAVLGVPASASASDVSRAYRKLAIVLHPDKQKDKSAAEIAAAALQFERVTKARDALLDTESRASFDAMLAARRARAERDLKRDATQRDMLERLVRREADARAELMAAAEQTARDQLDRDVNRLRQELRRHEASRDARRRQREADVAAASAWQKRVVSSCLRVTWADAAGVLSERLLRDVFGQYGELDAVLMSRAPKREALISFASASAAATALDDLKDDDTFAVAWTDAAAALDAAASAGASVASYEPYRPPQHPDVIGGVRVPQTPVGDDLKEHVAYERAVLEMLKGARPEMPRTAQDQTIDRLKL
jgi:hypothetical protein